jgi:hypothetical protein
MLSSFCIFIPFHFDFSHPSSHQKIYIHHSNPIKNKISLTSIKMKPTTIFSIVATVTSHAFAREIALGSRVDNPRPSSWIVGDNPCDSAVTLSFSVNANPCGERFSLHYFDRLHFENCGRSDAPLYADCF